MKEFASHRKDTYSFLSNVFGKELTAQQIKKMRENAVFNLLCDAGCGLDLHYFNTVPINQVEEELAGEYTALFLGPGKHLYPFESAHKDKDTDNKGTYWGESAVAMKKMVKQCGLEITGSLSTIPDHISVELEFMQKVVECEESAWNTNDSCKAEQSIDLEHYFFTNHLNNWVPDFCRLVEQTAQHSFYKEMAKMTTLFLKDEEHLLQPGKNAVGSS